MASDVPKRLSHRPRRVAALAWIFGCAAYYYVRFTWMFMDQYRDAISDLLAQLADTFALSR